MVQSFWELTSIANTAQKNVEKRETANTVGNITKKEEMKGCEKMEVAKKNMYREVKEDMVNSPKHYKLRGLDIESVDVIRATMTPEEFQGWLKGNAMKYLHRLGKKDDAAQDAKKAMKYLEWLVKELEK